MKVMNIDGLSSDGDGVGRLDDGRVVFVPGTFPGDRVSVRLLEGKAKVAYGEVVDRHRRSRAWIESKCSRLRCGGCVWRDFDLEAQRVAKRDRVIETFRRIGGVDISSDLDFVSENVEGWGYRHRVRLHAVHVDDEWQLGHYTRRSHTLVSLTECPVLWPELERAAIELARAIRDLPKTLLIHDIDIVYSRRDARAAAHLRVSGEFEPLLAAISPLADRIGLEVVSTAGRWRKGRLTLRYDHRRAGEFDLKFEPGVFTQAHPAVNDTLVDAVLEAVRPQSGPRVLELHAGIGNFSVPLARAGATLVAVEQSKRAVILNRRNAESAGVRMNALASSDRDALEHLRDFETILLDPPRTGAKRAAAMIPETAAHRVVYVSCDPATLSRDVALLRSGGFAIESIRVFDMFPQTPHVETLVTLKRS